MKSLLRLIRAVSLDGITTGVLKIGLLIMLVIELVRLITNDLQKLW